MNIQALKSCALAEAEKHQERAASLINIATQLEVIDRKIKELERSARLLASRLDCDSNASRLINSFPLPTERYLSSDTYLKEKINKEIYLPRY